jgi:hypothetical protein
MTNPMAGAGVDRGAVDNDDSNVRSSGYFIARTVVTCWSCGAPTGVVALALPPGHETFELGDDEPDYAGAVTACDTWDVAPHNAFLFYVQYLPNAILRRLTALAQAYRLTGGREDAEEDARGDAAAGADPDAGGYWANHCERCGFLLDDHELHCEPDGGFLPTSAAGAMSIHLTWFGEPFEATAAGYAIEPQFFDSMSRD